MTSIGFDYPSEIEACDICFCERVVKFAGMVLCGTCYGIVLNLAARAPEGRMTELDVWQACETTRSLRGNL